MGGGASKNVYSRTTGDDKGLDMVCDAVGADEKAVCKFFDEFKKCDSSGDGSVTVSEFLAHFGVTNGRECQLMRRAFHIIDESDGDAERKLDFITFFVALHNFCVMDKTEMLHFAFKMFDRDNSGEVTKDELRAMVIMVHGVNKKTDVTVDELFKKIDLTRDGGIACHEFELKSGLLNNLLMPVHQSQAKLRDSCMGQGYWTRAEGAKRAFEAKHPCAVKDHPKYAKYFQAQLRGTATSADAWAAHAAHIRRQMEADGCDAALLDTPNAQAPGGSPPCFDGNLVHLYFQAKAGGEKARVRREAAHADAATEESAATRAADAAAARHQAQLDEEARWSAERDAQRAREAAASQAALTNAIAAEADAAGVASAREAAASQAARASAVAAEAEAAAGGGGATAYDPAAPAQWVRAPDGEWIQPKHADWCDGQSHQPEWVQFTDPASGYPYWYNESTGLSSWEDPSLMW